MSCWHSLSLSSPGSSRANFPPKMLGFLEDPSRISIPGPRGVCISTGPSKACEISVATLSFKHSACRWPSNSTAERPSRYWTFWGSSGTSGPKALEILELGKPKAEERDWSNEGQSFTSWWVNCCMQLMQPACFCRSSSISILSRQGRPRLFTSTFSLRIRCSHASIPEFWPCSAMQIFRRGSTTQQPANWTAAAKSCSRVA